MLIICLRISGAQKISEQDDKKESNNPDNVDELEADSMTYHSDNIILPSSAKLQLAG